jgi:hypothetical protein
MSGIFMLIGLFLLFICAVLYLMPNSKILNFVAYGTDQTQRKINRYASVRLLLPGFVFTAASFFLQARPELAVPLFFPGIISIMVSVVWIAAGVTRLGAESGKI